MSHVYGRRYKLYYKVHVIRCAEYGDCVVCSGLYPTLCTTLPEIGFPLLHGTRPSSEVPTQGWA